MRGDNHGQQRSIAVQLQSRDEQGQTEGIVALSAGRITFNLDTGEVVFEGGLHPEFDQIEWCSMLA